MGSENVNENVTPAHDPSTVPQSQAEDQLHEPTPTAKPEPADPGSGNPQAQTPKVGRLAKAKAYVGQVLNNKHVRTAGKAAGAVALVAAGAVGMWIYKGRGGA